MAYIYYFYSIINPKLSLKFESFIAKRLKSGTGKDNFTKPIIHIAIVGIALGVMVMILSTAIVTGFQKEVANKVMNFNAQIQITKLTQSDSYESKPIINAFSFSDTCNIPEVKNIQPYATKAGIVRADQDIHGVILKGVDHQYNWDYLNSCLIEGSIPTIDTSKAKREVIISKKLSQMLQLGVGDKCVIYFITPKKNSEDKILKFNQRKYPFYITGIYETGLVEDFDDRFIVGNIHYIQKLNDWNKNTVGGFEVLLNNPNQSAWEYALNQDYPMEYWIKAFKGNLDPMEEVKNKLHDEYFMELQNLKINTVSESYPQIFDWLGLFDLHVIIIITIIVIISVINMSAVLLIQIIEKTSFIGILKAMGASSKSIRKIFMYRSVFLVSRGLLLGNIFGISLCLLQYYTHIFPLDENVYYLSYVPINFNIGSVILINIITIIACVLVLIIPAKAITKISPSKSIRFN